MPTEDIDVEKIICETEDNPFCLLVKEGSETVSVLDRDAIYSIVQGDED